MDTREKAAKYYDLWPPPFDGIPFYKKRIPSPEASVLELGCGTGRVLIPLAASCAYIHGLDDSGAMLDIFREKMTQAEVTLEKAVVGVAHITDFALGCKFDLIIAPYRVFQNLETDIQVDGLFRCVRNHLKPNGSSILNVFKPYERQKLRALWTSDQESLCWEKIMGGERIVCYERRPRINLERLVVYPEIIYRSYEGETLKDEVVFRFAMRCYYPDQFEKVIIDHGFAITDRWGGYNGELYGEGDELVIQFRDSV